MAHLDEVIVKVDDALAEGVIAHMNELLIALSDDAQLSREERYIQQQRLRTGTPWARTKSMINPPTSWLATSTAMVVAAPTF